jgi:hypothetical protein
VRLTHVGLLAVVSVGLSAAAVWYGVGATPEQQSSLILHRPKRHRPVDRVDLRNVDLSGLPIPRSSPCARVDDRDLVLALGGPPTGRVSYGPGRRATLAPGVTDVSQEYSCAFEAPAARARVWIFAAPVDVGLAHRVIKRARAVKGCTSPADTPAYGEPSLTEVCSTDPAGTTASLRGLFGQTWLSCQLSLPPPAGSDTVLRRAERWCVHVATTLARRN